MRSISPTAVAAAVAASACMLLAGCTTPGSRDGAASVPAQAEVAAQPAAEALPAEPPPPPRKRPLPDGALLDLLAAEIELRRGHYTAALPAYARQAFATRDPGVVAMAARLAQYVESPQARALAELWLDVAPDLPDARALLAQRLLAGGDLEAALGVLAERPGLPSGALDDWLGQVLAAPADRRAAATAALARQHSARPAEVEVTRALAVLAWHDGDADRALALLATLPADERVVGTRLEVLQAAGRDADAEAVLADAIAADGDARGWRMRYAQLHIDAGNLAGARAQLQKLRDEGIDDDEVVLTAAYVEIGDGRHAAARVLLEPLLAGRARDIAHIYLARIAEADGDAEAALAELRAVGVGSQYPLARREAARLLAGLGRLAAAREELAALRAGEPESAVELYVLEASLLNEAARHQEARALLTTALAEHDGDSELLYGRALASAALADVPAAEADLRRILAEDADHVAALNALGFTLADLTDRHEEALALVARALALSPDDAAIVDSMGWVLYRRGEHAEALRYLRQAWEETRNDEIGAHYGEVLWVTGDEAAARSVWQQALEAKPGSAIVERTMQRLGVAP
jgi:tetratricopeptide (TPR) repeat protein